MKSDSDILNFLNDPAAHKVLVTLGEDTVPHAVVKSSLQHEDGKVQYWELLESSRSNRNMTDSLWFGRPVSILLSLPDGQSWEIIVKIERAVVSGRLFGEHYIRVRRSFGDVDLATLWILHPTEIREQTLSVRLNEEAERHPYFLHIDRLALNQEAVL
ncbi:hypothetical protein FACS1894189_7340 [Planctomycetales bacterium]|nr:hypothetical protein FACS1894189_7340 [Planctomycetales bacterium]